MGHTSHALVPSIHQGPSEHWLWASDQGSCPLLKTEVSAHAEEEGHFKQCCLYVRLFVASTNLVSCDISIRDVLGRPTYDGY